MVYSYPVVIVAEQRSKTHAEIGWKPGGLDELMEYK
jgi:hypothetical protein